MTAPSTAADTAYRVADCLRSAEGPWDVFGERIRRYEIHLNGRSIELVRGPIELEGYGLRVLRPRDGAFGSGFHASIDLSEEGIRSAWAAADKLTRYSSFPAKKVDLPRNSAGPLTGVEIRDAHLWSEPEASLQEYVDGLLASFDPQGDVAPSFGSVRATLTETTIANSTGLHLGYSHTTVDFEVAVKASGGPEGAPPGEYWVNESTRRLEPERLETRVEEWCRFARDVRRAQAAPSGELATVLPASVLTGILPDIFGSRLTGGARLMEIAPTAGTPWGAEGVTVYDEGRVPWAIASSPVDDEGTPQRRRTMLDHGKVSELLYDTLHAGAFDTVSTGSSFRGVQPNGFRDWRRFLHPAHALASTLTIGPGTGGSDAEVVEAAGEGIWVQQLGWPIPDPVSGAFGGELRIGYRIRNGKIAEPIRGGTVGGVVMAPPGKPSLLAGIEAIGASSTLCEWVLSPTVLVRPLTVVGAKG